MTSLMNKVIARIYKNGRGWSFSRIDFSDLGSSLTIGSILFRLEKDSKIRRVVSGIYDYPGVSKLTDELLPIDIPGVAQALARKFGWTITPSGETALNALGISNQLPSKYVYVSNGRSTKYSVDNRELQFKKGMLKESQFKYPESALLVQALRAYGKDNLTAENLEEFRDHVDHVKFPLILKDTMGVTEWVYEAIKRICR